MRITFAVALVSILSSSVLAQESIQIETGPNLEAPASTIGTFTDGPAAEISTNSITQSVDSNSIAPVLYQEGIVVEGAADAVDATSVVGAVEGEIQGTVVTEPSSVVSGEVIQSAPIYSEAAPVEGGTVISDGGAMMTSSPAVGTPVAATPSCGCGGNAGAAPMTYSGAPMTYSSAPMEAAPAPVMTYSSAPVQYSAPASSPCCNQPRRGFFRTLFGN